MANKTYFGKLIVGFILLAFAGALLLACGTSPSKAGTELEGTGVIPEETDEDIRSVNEFLDTFQERYSARDIKGVSRLFMDISPVMVDFEGRLTAYTIEEWLDMTENVFDGNSRISDKLTERSIIVYGKIAVATCRYEFKSAAEHSTGHDIFSLLRTPDGWRIVSLMYSGERE